MSDLTRLGRAIAVPLWLVLLATLVGRGDWQLLPVAVAILAVLVAPPLWRTLCRARTTVDELSADPRRLPPCPVPGHGEHGGRDGFCAGCDGWDPPPVDELHPRRLARTRRDVRHG